MFDGKKLSGKKKAGHAGEIVSWLAWEHVGIFPEELEVVNVEKDVWASLLNILSACRTPEEVEDKGWIDAFLTYQKSHFKRVHK